ncbi:MAG TPA: response regulator [Gammaproteobacteria bacterium]|nr:response regulator [Gammaproteobacteria bacterium]
MAERMDERLKRGFKIGEFRVEPLSGRVTGPSGAHHVQPKVIDVLLCLAAHAGELVERDAIVAQVWGRASSEEVLTRCISELRTVLGDDRGTPRYIQTVPKRGYRLLEGVQPLEAGRSSAQVQARGSARPAGAPAAPKNREGRALTVLLVDDHALFREGIKLQLEEHDPEVVCLEAGSVDEALKFTDRTVDLILLDFGLPGVKGLDAIARIKEAFAAPITIVSASDDANTIKSAIARGALGFIPKSMSKKEFFAALGLVRAGVVYLPPQVLFGAAPGGDLSEMQQQVLTAAVRGATNEQIAAELGVTVDDVEVHLRRAYRALGVDNRTDAVYELAKRGLRLG